MVLRKHLLLKKLKLKSEIKHPNFHSPIRINNEKPHQRPVEPCLKLQKKNLKTYFFYIQTEHKIYKYFFFGPII